MIRIGFTLSMMRREGRPYPDWELIADIKKAGFDYVELPLNALVALPDEARDGIKALLKANDISCETMNQALPGDMRIVGTHVDDRAIDNYLDRAAAVFHEFGGKRIIFGSAPSKNVPAGFPRDEAFDQVVSVLRRFSQRIHPVHELIAVEPINRNDANLICNTVEGMRLVDATDRGNVGLCLDYFHMVVEQEPMNVLEIAAPYIAQLHFCQTDRTLPLFMDEGMKAFVSKAREVGYDKRMTFEADCSDPSLLRLAVDEVRKYL